MEGVKVGPFGQPSYDSKLSRIGIGQRGGVVYIGPIELSSGVEEIWGISDNPLWRPGYGRLITQPPSIPLIHIVRDLAIPGYSLSRPITVVIERDDDVFVAGDDWVFMYGVGETPDEALEDYCYALIEYYELLLECEGELVSQQERHLEELKRALVRS